MRKLSPSRRSPRCERAWGRRVADPRLEARPRHNLRPKHVIQFSRSIFSEAAPFASAKYRSMGLCLEHDIFRALHLGCEG